MTALHPVVVCDPEDGTPRTDTPIHLAAADQGGETLPGSCPVLYGHPVWFVDATEDDVRTRPACRRCQQS